MSEPTWDQVAAMNREVKLKNENDRLRDALVRITYPFQGKWHVGLRDDVDISKYLGDVMTTAEWERRKRALDISDGFA